MPGLKIKTLILLVASITILWVGLIVAAKWAEHSLNRDHHAPMADEMMQQLPSASNPDGLTFVEGDTSANLPFMWDAPPFSFADQDNKTITDHDLRGHVWIADFIFTQCVTACPIMTSKMMILQKQIHQPDVRFISFSVDPAHDTPPVLKQYAALWHGDESRWRLLSTDPAGLKSVTTGMKVTVQATDDKDNPIMHSSLFLLVDKDGKVRGIYDSIDSEATEKLVDDVSRLDGPSSSNETSRTRPEPGSGQPGSSGNQNAVARGLATCQSMGCLACHSQSRIAPPLASLYNGQVRLADHRTVWVDEAYLHESIVDPNAKVVAGYLPTMPSYRLLLNDDQLSDVLAYIKSLSTNPPGGHGVVATASTEPSSDELLVTDVVCKMQVRAEPTAPQTIYKGKTYFFCSEQCRDRFLKDPEHFKEASGKLSQ